MDMCVIQFMTRHWWRRVEGWFIAMLLVTGGMFFGFQLGQWALADSYRQQVAEIRAAYDEAALQRDHRLDELTRKTSTAADKATNVATTATKAVDKADEALNRISP
ncbi:NADH-ubiquinone oxidoreductase MWFE subunit [Pseudomonas phage PseuP_222]|nr:NADH-ubiquinone oxidoreductase MWFE subunit [Pseudomonas phage PseuP_222]